MSRGGHNHCGDYTRSQLFRAGGRAGGRGPARDRARGARSRRHRPDPAQVHLPQRGHGPGRLRRLEAAAGRLRGGHRARREQPTASSFPSSSTAASTRSACSRRSTTRSTSSLRPNLTLPAGRRPHLLPRTRGCSGTPRPRAWRRSTPRARSPPSRRSATPTPTSRTSPRATTTRSARSRSATARAGWAATSTRSATTRTRCRASRWTAPSPPCWPPPTAPSRRSTASTATTSGSRSSDPIEQDMFDSFERMGAMPSDTPALAQVRRATAQTEKLRQDLGGVGGFTSPVAYPDTDFAHQLAGLAAFIQFGLPIRVATIRAPGGYDTHSAPGQRPRPQPARDLRGAARLPARPRGARPRRTGS